MNQVFLPLIIAAFLISPWAMANTIVVTTADDEFDSPSGGDISLREAIRDAGTQAATICFDPSLSGRTLTLTMGKLIVSGVGHGKITIDGSSVDAPPIISGNFGGIVIQASARDLDLKELIVTKSFTSGIGEGAISCYNANLTLDCVKVRNCQGPALYVRGSHSSSPVTASVTAMDCEFYDNHIVGTSGQAGVAGPSKMGCVFVISGGMGTATALLDRCSLYHNSARNASGVVGVHGADVTIRNCTLAENSAPTGSLFSIQNAGAIRVTDDGSVSIENSTIVDNLQYGVVAVGQVSIRESIIANNKTLFANSAGSNLSGSNVYYTSLGGNLSNETSSAFDHPFDKVGDPKLSRLGYNGGKVLTCFPLVGSPAIDGGDPNRISASPTIDGRGLVRLASHSVAPGPNTIDIGAVEIRANEDLIVLNDGNGGAGTLRTALSIASRVGSVSGRRIVFDRSLNGKTIRLTSALEKSAITNRHVDIDASDLPEGITLSIDGDDDILYLANQNDLSLHNIRFAGFETKSTNSIQGYNPIRIEGDVSIGLDCVAFEGNLGPFGGGIQSRSSGRIHLTGCQFNDNGSSSFSGNSIRAGQNADGALVQVWNSSFVKNTSQSIGGGAVSVQGFENRLEVRNCVFSDNLSNSAGSSIEVSGSSAKVAFSTFFNNTASSGAIRLANNRVDISDCLFKDNVSVIGPAENDISVSLGTGLGEVARNLTTNSDNSKNFFPTPSNTVGVSLPLAPLDYYGGTIRVLPSVEGSPVIDSGDALILRSLDATGKIGVVGFQSNAGAVEEVIALPGGVNILGMEINGGELNVTFEGTAGSLWTIEVSSDLVNFTPAITNLALTGSPQVRALTLPNPVPDQYFFRFVLEL